MCKYTFLLPAYKGRFLDEMLRSIQGQTYTNFKVIISDDCSPEGLIATVDYTWQIHASLLVEMRNILAVEDCFSL